MTGTALEFDTVDVFVLSNGHTIRRIDIKGDTLWGYTTPDMGYASPFLYLHPVVRLTSYPPVLQRF
jgi:hypothetical protein